MPMRTRQLVLILVIIASLVGAGLGYTYYQDVSAIRDSTVVLQDVRLTALTLTQATLAIQVTVTNPSSREITDLSVAFDLSVAAVVVGEGRFPVMTIAARASQTQEMNITLYFVGLTSAVITALREGNFAMTITGTVSGRVLFGLATFSQSFSSSYVVL